MKYLYYCIWITLAYLHKNASLVHVLKKLLMWLKPKSEAEKDEWNQNYNEASLNFPGGILDWYAFGLLVLLIYLPTIFLSVRFKLGIFSSKLTFGIMTLILIGFCYYWIYIKSRTWLVRKINLAKIKYFFRV